MDIEQLEAIKQFYEAYIALRRLGIELYVDNLHMYEGGTPIFGRLQVYHDYQSEQFEDLETKQPQSFENRCDLDITVAIIWKDEEGLPSYVLKNLPDFLPARSETKPKKGE